MYTKRIQLINYGPLEKLDIEFPFEGETPKPVVLVGENGSGKTILLSHIVNGLIAAKDVAFPETPEVELGKVYKLRSSSYIKPGSEYYFGRVDFGGSFFISEIRARRNKQEYADVPTGISGSAAHAMWEKVGPEGNDHYDSNLISDPSATKKVEEIFAKNCVLYFPFNRFEEPAWLNEENLKAQAQYMDTRHLAGHTNRKVVASSPLHENQNWLFDVIYDRAAFELQTHRVNLPVNDGNTTIPLPLFAGYSGDASRTYETALQIVRIIARKQDIRFGIGRRHNRVISIMTDVGFEARQLVPNIFQLSSGETSLLNLFLSILRDFDLCGATSSSTTDIRGIAVVDEIDLHLHAVHQHEVLPELIKMFPNVQFVVTTHSSLFVLGMQRVFGEDGFALYLLPQGHRISPEEFSEFGEAYRAFTETSTFSNDIRAAVRTAQSPILYVEGTTDIQYLRRAAVLLDKEAMLEGIMIKDGGGKPGLKTVWSAISKLSDDLMLRKVMLLYDCDYEGPSETVGNRFRRKLPKLSEHPIEKGIENLFGETTLAKARQHKPAFIDVDPGRTKTVRGEHIDISDVWTVNGNEKSNLCDWLCENGTKMDFDNLQVIFELLGDLVDLDSSLPEEVAVPEQVSSASVTDVGGATGLVESP